MLARIPDRSTAAFVACLLRRAHLLSESRLASVSEQELMDIGISQTDARFLKLGETDWDGLDQLCRSLQACPAESLCRICEGCRVRFAVYAHGLHSVQALLSNIDGLQMIPLGIRALLRNRQQQAHNHSGELEAAAPNCGAARGQAVDDVLRLDVFVNPAGNNFCISCNTEILDDSLVCLGCPAHCHFACWRKARHSDWRELVFHPIPPCLTPYVVTLSELWEIVSVAPSEVGTLYCFLGVPGIGDRTYGHVRVRAANIYQIPGNPQGV